MRRKKPNFNLGLKNKPIELTEGEKQLIEYKKHLENNKNNDAFDSLFKKVFKNKHMKKIGQGNQGVVYKIISDDYKKYAVKETEMDVAPLKELHYMRQIECNKVVKLFDYREHKNNLYMIIEYMNAGTLKEMLYFAKKIEEDYLKLFIYQILEGLEFLHKKLKIFHRDIKPANLIFNLEGHLKLADFGVSAQVMKTLDQKSTYVGTEKYMAPERLIGPKHGSKSDIWSLGIIAYECFYGYHPVKYENQFDLIEKMKIFKMPENADPVFKDFILSCLSFDPSKRLSANQLLSHPWLLVARKIKEDNKIEVFCKKYLVNHFKKNKSKMNKLKMNSD